MAGTLNGNTGDNNNSGGCIACHSTMNHYLCSDCFAYIRREIDKEYAICWNDFIVALRDVIEKHKGKIHECPARVRDQG